MFQKSENKGAAQYLLKMIAVFFLVVSVVCCGKKGPPVPPDLLPLPSVNNLEVRQVDNSLELTWLVHVGKNMPEPDGFRIYRSKRSLADFEECPGCPDVFEKVGELETGFSLWGRTENRYTYRDTLEEGFAYRYKVLTFTDRGLTSEWSDTVELIVESKSFGSEN